MRAVAYATVLGFFLFVPQSSAADTCSEAYLTDADKGVVSEINRIEEAANMTHTILKVGPIALMFSGGNSIDMALAATTQDYKLHAESLRAIDQIKRYRITTEIEMHMIDLRGAGAKDPGQCRKKFFESLSKQYQ